MKIDKQPKYTPPVFPPASREMWDWLDESNAKQMQVAKSTREKNALKESIVDALIGFGKAAKLAEEKLREVEKSIDTNNYDYVRENQEFYRKFGVDRYKLDWSKRV